MAKLYDSTPYKYIKSFIGLVDVGLRQVELSVGSNDDYTEFDVNLVITYNKYGKTISDFFTEGVYDNPEEAMKRAKTIVKNFTKAYPKATIIKEVEFEE